MKCNVRGISFFQNDDGRRKFVTLAMGECHWQEIGLTMAGVRLVHYPDKGYRALPPLAKLQNGAFCISWLDTTKLAESARDAMLAMYEKMGGSKPEAAANNAAAKRRVAERKAKRQFIPLHELNMSGIDETLPGAERVRLALEAESKERGVECFTEMFQREVTPTNRDEYDRAVLDFAKRKGQPVPVRSVEQIDMDVAEMGLSRPETAGLARTLGVA
ncbi:MAG: hypothetical protein WBB98_15540 [Xanthobacteraceae bacterium]